MLVMVNYALVVLVMVISVCWADYAPYEFRTHHGYEAFAVTQSLSPREYQAVNDIHDLINNLSRAVLHEGRTPGHVIHDYVIDYTGKNLYIESALWNASDSAWGRGRPLHNQPSIAVALLDVYQRVQASIDAWLSEPDNKRVKQAHCFVKSGEWWALHCAYAARLMYERCGDEAEAEIYFVYGPSKHLVSPYAFY